MKYLSSTIIFVHNFTLKITSVRARIRARLNKGPVVSLVEKNKGPGYKTSKYGKRKDGGEDRVARIEREPDRRRREEKWQTRCCS